MNILDYNKIAREISEKHFGQINFNFITLGLAILIKETDLKENYNNYRLTVDGDKNFSFRKFMENGTHDPYINFIKYNGTYFHSIDIDFENLEFSPSILGNEEKDLLSRFNSVFQEVESFEELKEEFSSDEIMFVLEKISPRESDKIPFILLAQEEENNELNKYGLLNLKVKSRLYKLEQNGFKSKYMSLKFKSFTDNVLADIVDFCIKKTYPINSVDDFNDFSSNSMSKIFNMDGLSHLDNTLDYETLLEVISSTPELQNTVIGAMLTKSNLDDIILAYYNSQELEEMKTYFDLFTKQILMEPSIEDIVNEPIFYKAIQDLFDTIYKNHPEIEYNIQDISIHVKDIENPKNNILASHIDSFYFLEDQIGILDLATSGNSELLSYCSKFGLYTRKEHMDIRENDIIFVSKNQFNADIIAITSKFEDEDYHSELRVNELIINPTKNPEHIDDLLENIIEYAKNHKMVVVFNLPNDSAWGNMSKENYVKHIEKSLNKFEGQVPYAKLFGDYNSNTKEYLIYNYLSRSPISYEKLPALQKEMQMALKKEVQENPDKFDIDYESVIEPIYNKYKSENIKNKI